MDDDHVCARVCEREKIERSERVKGQKEEEMYERESIRDGVEKDKEKDNMREREEKEED